jgi:molecular chaperone DnaK
MKQKTDELTKVFNDLAQKLYAQAGQQAGPDGGAGFDQGAAGPGDDVVDADFEEIKDDK